MKYISRDYVRSHRSTTIFVFGDNMAERGYGGQAKEMRGEPNVIGIPTKWSPGRDDSEYFCDEDWTSYPDIARAIGTAFDKIESKLIEGYDLVIPADGIGTGLAELDKRAPEIFKIIKAKLEDLQRRYGA
jgi:hypothetical protein